MNEKERLMEMYRESALLLIEFGRLAIGTPQGSQERDRAEQIYGARQAYGRALKEIYGVKGSELQDILNDIHDGQR